jgi:hypothetical protein
MRDAFEKAKSGGKKAKAGKGPKTEEKPQENCVLFVALEYPDW